MTIGEHLQFSVLTAPIAAIDRRGLSQAWYSALYRTSGESQKRAFPPSELPFGERSPRGATATHSTPQHRNVTDSKIACVREDSGGRNVPAERRAPRSALARKIERALLHPGAAARKGSFTIEGAAGRVQILLRAQGSRVKLVAICSPKAKAQVAEALAQARYALATRGVLLETQTREAAAC